MLRKIDERFELLPRERNMLSTDGNSVVWDVDFKPVDPNDLRYCCGSALQCFLTTQHSLHPRNQLPDPDWLQEVILGTEFQSHDFINLGSLCGQEKNRNAGCLWIALEPPAHFPPIHLWHHNIK